MADPSKNADPECGAPRPLDEDDPEDTWVHHCRQPEGHKGPHRALPWSLVAIEWKRTDG